jgi:hypothetical protein
MLSVLGYSLTGVEDLALNGPNQDRFFVVKVGLTKEEKKSENVLSIPRLRGNE